jgi:hypothetical protein
MGVREAVSGAFASVLVPPAPRLVACHAFGAVRGHVTMLFTKNVAQTLEDNEELLGAVWYCRKARLRRVNDVRCV